MPDYRRMSEIPGHEGYFVDTDGDVYSQWVNRGQHGKVKGFELKKLKTSKGASGYKTIRFGRNGTAELVHRLVYTVFNGHIADGLFICHKDGNPENNKLENLYAGTQSQNMKDTVKHGTCSLTKLSEEQVKEIINLRRKMMVKDIAFKYGVTRQTVTSILRGHTWTHLTREEVENNAKPIHRNRKMVKRDRFKVYTKRKSGS